MKLGAVEKMNNLQELMVPRIYAVVLYIRGVLQNRQRSHLMRLPRMSFCQCEHLDLPG